MPPKFKVSEEDAMVRAIHAAAEACLSVIGVMAKRQIDEETAAMICIANVAAHIIHGLCDQDSSLDAQELVEEHAAMVADLLDGYTEEDFDNATTQ